MNLHSLLSPAIRVAGAGLGAAFAGPLGASIGGYVGGAFGDTVQEFTKKLGEESGKKLFETGQDTLLDSLKSDPLSLEALYRESLRLSLAQAAPHPGLADTYPDWFRNWNTALASPDALNLLPVTVDQATPTQLDDLFRRTLIRLDAQGAATTQHALSLNLPERSLPDPLVAALDQANLPQLLDTTFRTLLVKPAYDQAWKQATQRVDTTLTATLARMEAVLHTVDTNTAATYQLVQQLVQSAAQQGQISDDRKAKDAEIARLATLVTTLQQQLALRAAEPTEQKLSTLIAQRNIPAAVALKTQQVEDRRHEAAKLPRDYFELGTLHELNFDWSAAYAAYKEAWQLHRDPEYGFRLAFTAQYLNHVHEAIDAYQAVLAMLPPDDPAHRALILTNLASLLLLTARTPAQTQAAEAAYLSAIAIYRGLDNASPALAGALNNFGVFYQQTGHLDQAESTYTEALSLCPPDSPFAPPPNDAERALHADILNNLGNLLNDTERAQQAQDRYLAAVAIYRSLMSSSPGDTAWRLATALNNLAGIYADADALKPAEDAYLEAFRIYQGLANAQPEVYLPTLAQVLYNVGEMYLKTARASQAITPYLQSLAHRRALARKDPETFQPKVAETLNSLGNAYRALPDAPATPGSNAKKSEEAFAEAIAIRRTFAIADPTKYEPKLASSLMNLANLYAERNRFPEAQTTCDEAETKLTPHWQAGLPAQAGVQPHANLMAKILWTRTLIGAQLQEPLDQLCAYAQRALAAGGEPTIRQDVNRFLTQYCTPNQSPNPNVA